MIVKPDKDVALLLISIQNPIKYVLYHSVHDMKFLKL